MDPGPLDGGANVNLIGGPFRADRALLGAAHAMEQAFAATVSLARPRPNLDKLREPTPELKSIVTHPPVLPG